MTSSLFRIRLADGSVRLARGSVEDGPRTLLPAGVTLADLLGGGDQPFWERVMAASAGDVPDGWTVLPPVDSQPIWAAGVTYERSRQARTEESEASTSVYDRVYDAARPELFFKSEGWSTCGPDEAVGVRRDSSLNAPEAELTLVLDSSLRIAGFTIGNDVSSRSIEGANPLYLPQAKVYERSCAIGPSIVPASSVELPLMIEMSVLRGGDTVFGGTVSTTALHRTLADLVAYLGRALQFPGGCFLMTGTGIVPPMSFSLAAGDVCVITMEVLGTLRNPVVAVGRHDVDAPAVDAGHRASSAGPADPSGDSPFTSAVNH
jgi:2-dehydro-3-deoxy-D-arabinonate dehydratase